MFLRQLGNKVLVLHSYRDGEGKVKQRRLAHFDGRDELQATLSGDCRAEWQRHIGASYPDLKANWGALWRKAEELAAGEAPTKRPRARTSRTAVVSARREVAAWREGPGGREAAAGREAGREAARVPGAALQVSSAEAAVPGAASSLAAGTPLLEQHASNVQQEALLTAAGALRGELGDLLRRLARCVEKETNPHVRTRLAAELGDLQQHCLGDAPRGLNDVEQLVREGELVAARAELERVVRQSGRTLAGGRRSFDSRDPAGSTRRRALELLGDVLQQLNEPESAAAIWYERVRCSPDPDAIAEGGASLQRLGRWPEAAEQYRRLPSRDARRYFHLASVHWAMGNAQEALNNVLRGLVRDRQVGEHLRALQKGGPARGYWQRYGDLWDSGGRRFLENVYKDPSVRFSLTRAGEKGYRPRQLLPASTREILLARCLPPR